MLVPSTNCPAACRYCFGPHQGDRVMTAATVDTVVQWLAGLGGRGPLEITFHGGEPLTAGTEYFRHALSALRDGLPERRIHFALQTNLWLLTDELAELFAAYGVSLGSSLDGPEHLNDAQRGAGYFRRTMAGIRRARRHGLNVGCICTFTPATLPHTGEIMDFFMGEGLAFTIHGAVPSLAAPHDRPWALTPAEYGRLLLSMLDLYLPRLDRIRIDTLDALCRSVSAGRGAICTFTDCLGGYLAVGPDGALYPCQRFVGLPPYVLGNVHDRPTRDDLAAGPVWRDFRQREKRLAEECAGCTVQAFCRGGCPYNVLAAGGDLLQTPRDPYGPAYAEVYAAITDRAVQAVLAEENLQAVVERVDHRRGLFRQGPLLSLMRGGPHPTESAAHARRIVAAVLLAAGDGPAAALPRMAELGLVRHEGRTRTALERLHDTLVMPGHRYNNLYLHLTFACNLRCTHCYASAGPEHRIHLPLSQVAHAVTEAARLSFRHAVLTGGEPLVYPFRDELLDWLAAERTSLHPLLTVLRTNLAVPLDTALRRRLAGSTDELVVSVDGDRATHDARRGAGTYDRTVANLRQLVDGGLDTDLSLACILPLHLVDGPPGQAVRALAEELGIRRVRFRPLLPLGRAVEQEPDIVPETMWGHGDPREIVEYGLRPTASCGLGQNLYVEPDGAAYPCYAWHGADWRLGSLEEDGLVTILESDAFRRLRLYTVDSNHRCRECLLRYLCGGACRAWNNLDGPAPTDPDAPPVDCRALHQRAFSLFCSALARLGIAEADWRRTCLPWPEKPPARVEYELTV